MFITRAIQNHHFDVAWQFSDGLARVSIGDYSTGKRGFSARQVRIASPPEESNRTRSPIVRLASA